jgi:hypothetical protein
MTNLSYIVETFNMNITLQQKYFIANNCVSHTHIVLVKWTNLIQTFIILTASFYTDTICELAKYQTIISCAQSTFSH